MRQGCALPASPGLARDLQACVPAIHSRRRAFKHQVDVVPEVRRARDDGLHDARGLPVRLDRDGDAVGVAVRMSLRVVPLTLAQANALVARLHRHHKPVVGHRFSLGCEADGKLVGAAIVGRPVAAKGDTNGRQYEIASVTRLVTDGTKNACSILYAAAARAAREMGFTEIETFILDTEPGTSLRAAGWGFVSTTPARSWDGRKGQMDLDGHTRRTDQPECAKQRWVKTLRASSAPAVAADSVGDGREEPTT